MKYIQLLILSSCLLYSEVNIHTNKTYQDLITKYGYQINKDENYIIQPELAFIGWSDKGLIAYIIREPLEAGDNDIATLYIQDTENDKIIEEIAWPFNDDFDRKFSITNSVGEFYKSIAIKYEMIYKVLHKYHIKNDYYLALNTFPIKLDNNHEINVMTQKTQNGEADGFSGFLDSFKLKLMQIDSKTNQISRSKFIVNQKINPRKWIYDKSILGYVKSPYQNKVVVIVARVARGWEGAPHVVYIEFYGAFLDKGF